MNGSLYRPFHYELQPKIKFLTCLSLKQKVYIDTTHR